jgi:spermidine synthase
MGPHGRRSASRFLQRTGQHASIDPHVHTQCGFVLSIGGAEQSHVNLADPSDIFYEYLRRIAHVVDLAAPAGEAIRALHLGAGALTLARYIQATRPGSAQFAVELERELLDFVLTELPMPGGTDLTILIADAREALAELHAEPGFDVVILDIFSGPEAPGHIACAEFYHEAALRLAPAGVLIVNVGDEPGLTLVRSQVTAMRTVFADVAASAEAGMFAGRYPGNIVLVGTQGTWPVEWTAILTACGPHPAKVVAGVELDALSS